MDGHDLEIRILLSDVRPVSVPHQRRHHSLIYTNVFRQLHIVLSIPRTMKMQITFLVLCFLALTNAYSYKRRKNCVKRPMPFPPTNHYYRPQFPLPRPMPYPRWPQWNIPAPTPVDMKYFEFTGQPLTDNGGQNLPLFPQPQPPIDTKPIIPDISGPVIVNPVDPVIDDSGPLRGDLAPGRDIGPPPKIGKPCNAM